MLQPLQNDFVRGTEGQRIAFRRGDPPQGIVLQRLRLALGQNRMKQGQMDSEIGIFVGHFHENIPGDNGHRQLLTAFPDKGLFPGFAGLHFSADKLPQKSPGLVSRALTS